MSATRCDDAFAGAFAASLGSGDDVSVAVKFASAAGAVASRKFSGQDTMPSKEEIIELLQNESD
jgi:ribokinase